MEVLFNRILWQMLFLLDENNGATEAKSRKTESSSVDTPPSGQSRSIPAVPQFAVAVSETHGKLMGEDGVVVECDGAGCVPMRAGSEMRFFRPWAPNAPSMTLEAPYRQPTVQKGGIVD